MTDNGILGSFLRLVRSRMRKNLRPSLKGLASDQDTPRTSSQHKDLFSSEEQDIGNKRQRQKLDIEEKGQWGRNKGRGKGYLSWGLPLRREETDAAPRQKEFYRGKSGNLVLR